MAILLYSSEMQGNEKRLFEMTGFPDVDIIRSIDDLKSRLSNPLCKGDAGPCLFPEFYKILVLIIQDIDELNRMLEFRELFFDLQVIMVIVNDDPETLSKAYQLRPRYINVNAWDFMDVAIVLLRMIKRHEHR